MGIDFYHIYLSDDPLVKHVKIHDKSKAVHSYMTCVQEADKSLGVSVSYVDSRVLLGFTAIGVNQAKCLLRNRCNVANKPAHQTIFP